MPPRFHARFHAQVSIVHETGQFHAPSKKPIYIYRERARYIYIYRHRATVPWCHSGTASKCVFIFSGISIGAEPVSHPGECQGVPEWDFDRSFLMDAWGNENSTAMARLVSIPVALAVESVLNDKIPYGVTAAPKSPQLVTSWLDAIKKEAQIFNFIDNLS